MTQPSGTQRSVWDWRKPPDTPEEKAKKELDAAKRQAHNAKMSRLRKQQTKNTQVPGQERFQQSTLKP